MRYVEAKKKKQGQAEEELGIPTQGDTSTRTSKRPRPEDSTHTERVRPPKWLRYSRRRWSTSASKENHSEDTLTKDDLDQILDELGRAFHGTPQLSSLRLEGGALTIQWFVTDGTWGRLKVAGCQEAPQACSSGSQDRGQSFQEPWQAAQVDHDLNIGPHTEPEPTRQRLISHVTIRRTMFRFVQDFLNELSWFSEILKQSPRSNEPCTPSRSPRGTVCVCVLFCTSLKVQDC
jgi:hypothetical protein